MNNLANATKKAVDAMKESGEKYDKEQASEAAILRELKALNSKMSWFVFLSIVAILVSIFFR